MIQLLLHKDMINKISVFFARNLLWTQNLRLLILVILHVLQEALHCVIVSNSSRILPDAWTPLEGQQTGVVDS